MNTTGGLLGSPLRAASHFHRCATMQLRLGRGADVNVVAGKFGTALQAASGHGRELDPAPVKILLDHRADINLNAVGKYGSALQAAARKGLIKIFKLLLEYGADPDVRGEKYGNVIAAAESKMNYHIRELDKFKTRRQESLRVVGTAALPAPPPQEAPASPTFVLNPDSSASQKKIIVFGGHG